MQFLQKSIFLISCWTAFLSAGQPLPQQEPAAIIAQIATAIKNSDQTSCAQLVTDYINQCGMVCKQQGGMLHRYQTIYCISSLDDSTQPITPLCYYPLLAILQEAASVDNWSSCIICQCTVFDVTTYESTIEQLTLQQIIDGIECVHPADFYLQPKYLKIAGASAAVMTIVIAGCYLKHPTWFAPFGNALQDLQDCIKSTFKYFTDPQTYEQYEKKYNLSHEGMTDKERKKRFNKWLSQDKRQQALDAEMSLVKKLERNHDLFSTDLPEKDRRKRYREWKRGDDHEKEIEAEFKIIEPWEKEHDLKAENLGEDYRIERYEQWLAGDLLRRQYLAIDRLMKERSWWQYKLADQSDEERLNYYLKHTDPIERSILENETLMKIQDNIVSANEKITSLVNKFRK